MKSKTILGKRLRAMRLASSVENMWLFFLSTVYFALPNNFH